MSRYTVLSNAEAEDDLASIWAEDNDRKQISEAANNADRLLAENPFQDAVYVSEHLWRRDVPPLRFYFEIREQDRVVVISNIVRLPD